MNPSDFQLISSRFAALCDLDAAAQQRELASVEDPTVREALRSMLAADATGDSFLDRTPTGLGRLALVRDLAEDDPDPAYVGPYRIVGRIGSGGMGVVYEAEQDHPHRRVALKVLHPALRNSLFSEYFRFEAQALAQLLHPGIPQVYEAREAEGVLYMVQELVRGRSLLHHVSLAQLATPARLRLLAEICDAVQHAHDAGILHRDLKPDNVRVTPEGRPKVLDFGIARPLVPGSSSAAKPDRAGTISYMSPEHRRGEALDVRADVFALGTIAYEVLGGVLPPEPTSLTHRGDPDPSGAPLSLRTVNPGLHHDVVALVERARHPDLASRTPTAAALAADLRRAAAHRPQPWRGASPLYWLEMLVRRHRVIATLLSVASVVSVAGFFAQRGLRAVADADRERAALRRLEATEQRVQAHVAAGQIDEAERELDTFAALEEHRRTRAPSLGWRRHGERLLATEPERALDAAALAWLSSSSSEDATASLRTLAHAASRTGRWNTLHAVLGQLGASSRATLGASLIGAAAACRDWPTVDEAPATPAQRRTLDRLRRYTPAPDGTLGLVQLDPHDPAWLASDDGDGFSLWGWRGGLRVEHTLPSLDALDVVREGLVLAAGSGALFVVAPADRVRTGEHALYVYQADLASGRWRRRASVPRAHTGAARVVDLPGVGPTLLFSATYPEWGFYALPVDAGPHRVADPQTHEIGAGVQSIAVADLDGEGTEELVLGQIGWKLGYQARVLDVAHGGDLRFRAARVMGAITRVAALPRLGKPDAIVVQKSPIMPTRALDSSQLAADGLYALRWVGGELLEERYFEPPVTEEGRSPPRPDFLAVADLDGHDEPAIVSRAGDAIWITLDPLGAATPVVVGGLLPLGLADLGGDHLPELLVEVADPDASEPEFLILGLGDRVLPATAEPDASSDTLGPPPSRDEAAVRAWARARRLIEIGLARHAAAGLAQLAGVQEPEQQAAYYRAAGTVFAEVGDPRARQALRAAFDRDPAAPGLAATLLQLDARAGDFASVGHVAAFLPKNERPVWLRGAFTAAPTDLPVHGPIDPRWRVHEAGPLRVLPDGTWSVRADSGAGVLLSTPVVLTGEGFAIDAEFDVVRAEHHTFLNVELVPQGEDHRVSGAGLFTHGGGGMTALALSCPTNPWALVTSPDTAPLRNRLRLRVAHRDDALTCQVGWGAARGEAIGDPVPLPAGRYSLQIRTFEDRPPQRSVDFDLRALRLWGASWPPRSEPEPLRDRALRRLATGQTREALDLLDPDDPAALWAWLLEGEGEALARAVDLALDAGDLELLARALRADPSTLGPRLAQRMGNDYLPFFSQVFELVLVFHPDSPDVQAAILDPALDHGRLIDGPSRRLGQLRAEHLLQRDLLPRARREAERLIRDTDPTDPSQREARRFGHLVLAEVLTRLGLSGSAPHLQAAEDLALSPELHAATLGRLREDRR